MAEADFPGCQAKILILGLNYAPEEIGIGPYTTGLAEALQDYGFRVRVVAGRPYYPRWQPFSGSSSIWRRSREHGVLITRCPHYIPDNPTGARRILHHASFAISAFLPTALAAIRRRPDVVFTIAPSFLSAPVSWLAARLTGARLWVHVQDFELEAAFATGLLDPKSPGSRLALRVERWLLTRADHVSSISPRMCERLIARGVAPDRVVELRNWANHDQPSSDHSPDDYRREWGLGTRKVALYSGNIANKQGLEIVIEAARILRHREDLVFVICGNGPDRTKLELQAAGIENIQFHDLQPADRINSLLRLAHVHLLPQVEAAADLVLPSKLTNMLASGRLVVATAAQGSGLASEVEGCGIVTPPGDPAAMAAAIRLLANDEGLATDLGAMALKRARDRWSLASITREFARRLCMLGARD